MNWLKDYGDCEGPLGFPMLEKAAKSLEELLKEHPEAEYQRMRVEKATAELSPGERADISWISTETIDHDKEIVLASGFRDDIFKNNPIVTLNHNYWMPPIGKSIWRQRLKEDDRRGIKAKTMYPIRPEEWPEDDPWPSDPAWALVKSGLMVGKSIGFIALRSHAPTEEEVRKRPELIQVRRIIDEWQLLEYCCCWTPANPEAVVEVASKSALKALDLKPFGVELKSQKKEEAPRIIPFRTVESIEETVKKSIASINLDEIVRQTLKSVQGNV